MLNYKGEFILAQVLRLVKFLEAQSSGPLTNPHKLAIFWDRNY